MIRGAGADSDWPEHQWTQGAGGGLTIGGLPASPVTGVHRCAVPMINRSIALDRGVTVIGSIARSVPASIAVITAAIATMAVVANSAKTGGNRLFSTQLIVA